MSLFKILSAPYRQRNMARYDKKEIPGCCLSDDEGDHFIADVTAYYKERDDSATHGVIVILMEECCRVIRENMKVLDFDVKKIERI